MSWKIRNLSLCRKIIEYCHFELNFPSVDELISKIQSDPSLSFKNGLADLFKMFPGFLRVYFVPFNIFAYVFDPSVSQSTSPSVLQSVSHWNLQSLSDCGFYNLVNILVSHRLDFLIPLALRRYTGCNTHTDKISNQNHHSYVIPSRLKEYDCPYLFCQ